MRVAARSASRACGSGRLLVVLSALSMAPLCAAPLTEQAALPHVVDASASAADGGTLDDPLQVDTNAAQRNLELLLETRGEGDPLQAPVARRSAPMGPGGAASAGAASGDPQARPVDHPDEGRAAARRIIGQVAPFLREHRLWLFGALGLLASVVAGVQLWRFLRAGAAERRLRDLAAQHRMPHRRRRSSRR